MLWMKSLTEHIFKNAESFQAMNMKKLRMDGSQDPWAHMHSSYSTLSRALLFFIIKELNFL